jgi:predicted permease
MLARLRVLARSLFRRSRAEREIDEEMRFHLESSAARLEARGMTRDDARQTALRNFGSVALAMEESRVEHRWQLLDDVAGDLRYALRTLRRSPGFTIVAVLTTALGVGANAAIFGVIDAVLLKTLPVRDPERLVFVSAIGANGAQYGGPPYPWVEQIRARSRSFDGMAVFAVDHLPVSIDGRAEQVLGQVASGSFFEMLGVQAALGRMLTPSDEQLNPPVAVISYTYWQRRFSGRRDVLGTVVQHRDLAVTIVGVTPRGFDGLQTGQPVDMTFPVTVVGFDLLRDGGAWWSSTVARVKPTVSIEAARSEVSAIFASIDTDPGTVSAGRRAQLSSAARGQDRLRRQLAGPLYLLLGAVGAVLLIGCANIANLLSVRAAARRRELAVRSAIGAGRGRLVRQLLTESLVLFSFGAIVGLLVAVGVQRLFGAYLAVGRNPIVLPLALDARVLGFAALIALIAGAISGLAPALRTGRRSGFTDLRLAGNRASGSSAMGRSLVVVQVAISVVILLGGSLLLRTLGNLRSVDVGFRPEGVMTFSIRPLDSYADSVRPAVFDQVLERVRQIPGIESASLSVLTPLSGRNVARRVSIAGYVANAESDRDVHVNHVSPGYFETLGIPVRLGRSFSATDDTRAQKVALMNAGAAAFYLGANNPLGASLSFGTGDEEKIAFSQVGVVGDAKQMNMRDPAPRIVYLPLAQAGYSPGRLTLAIRTRTSFAGMAELVRQGVRDIGTEILVSDIETLQQQVDRALLRERLVSSLSVGFAVLGVLLAAMGLYGVTSYSVVRRTDEIGIRMALGSSPAAVRWLMLREAVMMGAIGVAVGLPVSLAVAKTIERLLYGVAPTDPTIAVACVAVLLVVTSLAGYLPARRASRIDPVRALATP